MVVQPLDGVGGANELRRLDSRSWCHLRFNAGIACWNKLEITPPSFSNHFRYGTLEDVCVLGLNHDTVVTELLDLLDTSLLVGRVRGRECYVMVDHGHLGIHLLENACQLFCRSMKCVHVRHGHR